jgi:hypothetical protein
MKSMLFIGLSFCLINCKIKDVNTKVKQPISARFFSSHGFCTSGIVLNSDQTYCFEWGCENHSNVNLGTWKQIGDSIYLTPFDVKSLNFIKKQNIYGVKRDSIVFKIKDKLNMPISFFPIISYPHNANFEFGKRGEFYLKDISRYRTELEQQNEMDRLYAHNIARKNTSGYVIICTRDMEFIEFGDISLLTGKKFLLQVSEIEGDTVDIQLNTNKEAMAHSDLKWYNMENPIVYKLQDSILVNRNDTLIERKDYFDK